MQGFSSWLSFDASNRTFTGSPTNSHIGSLNIRVTVTDRTGATATDDFTITVRNINDAPKITSSPITNATEDTVCVISLQHPISTVGQIMRVEESITLSAPTLPNWCHLIHQQVFYLGLLPTAMWHFIR